MQSRILLTVIIAVIFYSCHVRDFKQDSNIKDETGNISRFVQFYRENILIANFSVEVASTDEERQKGLMFRKSLPEDAGMLFIFRNDAMHSFWMKNTYIPLDMIFIGSDMNVAGVFRNAVPLSEESISIDRPSRYVLEINAGLSEKYGIDENSKAVFINIFP
ncbi:MAG: DUF192 domain-containing protein [Deltaproteobacteria bacterium]|nr:DUF192 domain-containing protein [Deltaproteobacteria bacterium]